MSKGPSAFVFGAVCGVLAQSVVLLVWPGTDWMLRVAFGTAVAIAVQYGVSS